MPVNRTGTCSRRDLHENTLIIFPLIIIGSALGIVRFRGRYPFSALRPALPGIGATFPPGRRFLYIFVHKMFDTKRKKFF